MEQNVSKANTSQFDRLLKAAEVGEILGVSRSRAYHYMASGVLPVVRIGNSVRVSAVHLERWINEQSMQSVTSAA